MTDSYFGGWDDVPVNQDRTKAPTPIDELCLFCDEAVKNGDIGGWAYWVRLARPGEEPEIIMEHNGQTYMSVLRAYHAECYFMEATGGPLCVQGLCKGPDSEHHTGMTRRQQALWVWAWQQQRDGVARRQDFERLWAAFPGQEPTTDLDAILVRAQAQDDARSRTDEHR